MNIDRNPYKSVINIIKEIYSFPEKWDYYEKMFNDNFDVLFANGCKAFVKRFFELSDKIDNRLCMKENDLEDYRYLHIVSVFLLGLYLYDSSTLIKNEIDNEIEKHGFKTEKREFIFIWFLICMFHDLGYYIEEKSKYSSYSKFIKEEKLEKGENSLNSLLGVPELYNSVYKKYFNYKTRLKGKEKNDHGIAAGIIMFNDLCKIRAEKKLKECRGENSLHWGECLENEYRFAASIVIAHNIWFLDKNDTDTCKKKYKDKGLESLILEDGEYPIKINEHPILFLLCLIDSIDPIKTVKNVDLLDKIFLDIKDKSLIFKSELECGCHNTIISNVKKVNKWLTKVTEIDNKAIEIYFNI